MMIMTNNMYTEDRDNRSHMYMYTIIQLNDHHPPEEVGHSYVTSNYPLTDVLALTMADSGERSVLS